MNYLFVPLCHLNSPCPCSQQKKQHSYLRVQKNNGEKYTEANKDRDKQKKDTKIQLIIQIKQGQILPCISKPFCVLYNNEVYNGIISPSIKETTIIADINFRLIIEGGTLLC